MLEPELEHLAGHHLTRCQQECSVTESFSMGSCFFFLRSAPYVCTAFNESRKHLPIES